MTVCCERILKEKNGSLSCQISVFDFFKLSSATLASAFVLLDVGGDVAGDPHEELYPS
jgi:hypothetical protein